MEKPKGSQRQADNGGQPEEDIKPNTKKYDISDYISEIIKEDELFEIDDDVLLEKLKDELNETKEDRSTLMKQNQELKRLLKEFDGLKQKLRTEQIDNNKEK